MRTIPHARWYAHRHPFATPLTYYWCYTRADPFSHNPDWAQRRRTGKGVP